MYGKKKTLRLYLDVCKFEKKTSGLNFFSEYHHLEYRDR